MRSLFTTREVVSVIGFRRRAIALNFPTRLNATVNELRLLRKISFDERVSLPENLKHRVVSALVANILDDFNGSRPDALSAFRIEIWRLVEDKTGVLGCDITCHIRTTVLHRDRDIITPGHYVHFQKKR